MAWTEELKQQAVEAYMEGNPTAENSTEIIKQIAEDMEQSPNGVRMILVQAGVYVKKEAGSAPAAKGKAKADGDAPKRVSKESQIAALRAVIEQANASVEDEILEKLTGKAAAYFTDVLKAAMESK